jgi:hypothetical protein
LLDPLIGAQRTEKEQDQREDEGVPEPRTKFQQGHDDKTKQAICFSFFAPVFSVSVFVLPIYGLGVHLFAGLQTDMASMLDQTIEYLKQLQLKVHVSICIYLDDVDLLLHLF